MPSFDAKTTAEEAATALKDQIVGKNILIVGATVKSLGGEFLRVVAPYAKTLIVLGRSKDKLQIAVDAAFEGVQGTKPEAKIVQADTGSLASVRAAAAEVNSFELPIHLILGNVMVRQNITPTYNEDGFEAQFAGNHLGIFLLTSLLYPRLLQAGPGARVVQVSSIAHTYVPGIRFDDLHFKNHPEEYDSLKAYGHTKLANVLFVKELAKRAAKDGILAYSLHPGTIVTNGTVTSFDALPKDVLLSFGAALPDGTMNPEFWSRTIEQGVSTYVVAAFDPSIKEQSGAYLEDAVLHDDHVSPAGLSADEAAHLWTVSEELTQTKFL